MKSPQRGEPPPQGGSCPPHHQGGGLSGDPPLFGDLFTMIIYYFLPSAARAADSDDNHSRPSHLSSHPSLSQHRSRTRLSAKARNATLCTHRHADDARTRRLGRALQYTTQTHVTTAPEKRNPQQIDQEITPAPQSSRTIPRATTAKGTLSPKGSSASQPTV